jgi:hypothetical protein
MLGLPLNGAVKRCLEMQMAATHGATELKASEWRKAPGVLDCRQRFRSEKDSGLDTEGPEGR